MMEEGSYGLQIEKRNISCNLKKNDVKARQKLSSTSNARNPFVRAIDYLRRIIDTSSQIANERRG